MSYLHAECVTVSTVGMLTGSRIKFRCTWDGNSSEWTESFGTSGDDHTIYLKEYHKEGKIKEGAIVTTEVQAIGGVSHVDREHIVFTFNNVSAIFAPSNGDKLGTIDNFQVGTPKPGYCKQP